MRALRLLTACPAIALAAAVLVAAPGSARAQQGDAPGGTTAELPKDRPYEAVHIIQHIPFAKEGRLELAPVFGVSVNPRFTWHYTFGLSTVYHLKEAFGIELNLGWASGNQTEFDEEIRNKLRVAAQSPKIAMNAFGNVGVQISPIYGKFTILGALGHFDLYIATGVGLASTTLDPQNPTAEDEDDLQLLGSAGLGFRVFITDWMGLRLELRDYIFSAKEEPTTQAGAPQAADSLVSDVFNTLFLMGQVSFLLF
jgi:outer membrane beta-barrel protein